MINLLPKREKEIIRNDYRMRIAILGALFFLLSVIVSLVFLLPSYQLSTSKVKAENDRLMFLTKEQDTEETGQMQLVIKDINEKIKTLSEGRSTELTDTVLDPILSRRTNDIKIDQFAYQSSATGSKIDISGRAVNRESLMSFMRELEKDPKFAKVTLPISNFVKGHDIEFSMNIKVK